MNKNYYFSDQSGISLIEVLLACALGLCLMAGFIQIYLSIKKTYGMQQAIAYIQENQRFAAHFLNENIRMAGYSSCHSEAIDPTLAIQGYQNDLPAFLQGKVVAGTDVIVVGLCRLENGQEKFKQIAYFVGATSRKNKQGKTVYALYEEPSDGDKSELVPNVTDMKINYGIALEPTQDIEQYLTAEQIADWSLVRGVEIAVLLSSEDEVLQKPEAYSFNGILLPADKFLHKELNTYIALRERL